MNSEQTQIPTQTEGMKTPDTNAERKQSTLRELWHTIKRRIRGEQDASPEVDLEAAKAAIDRFLAEKKNTPGFLDLITTDNGGPNLNSRINSGGHTLLQMMRDRGDTYTKYLNPPVGGATNDMALAEYASKAAFALKKK